MSHHAVALESRAAKKTKSAVERHQGFGLSAPMVVGRLLFIRLPKILDPKVLLCKVKASSGDEAFIVLASTLKREH